LDLLEALLILLELRLCLGKLILKLLLALAVLLFPVLILRDQVLQFGHITGLL
jgi:hypothetical protein